jgi:hypothetical protein
MGQYKTYSQTLTSDFHKIDLADMDRSPHFFGTLTWSTVGRKTGSIRYWKTQNGLEISYAASGGQNICEVIPYTYTATQFGGTRKWFKCLSCGRRCRVLYGGRHFRCRQCYGTKYASQYEQAHCGTATANRT